MRDTKKRLYIGPEKTFLNIRIDFSNDKEKRLFETFHNRDNLSWRLQLVEVMHIGLQAERSTDERMVDLMLEFLDNHANKETAEMFRMLRSFALSSPRKDSVGRLVGCLPFIISGTLDLERLKNLVLANDKSEAPEE